MNFVRVALDVPMSTLFDYRAVDATADDIGRRVLVPFGRRIQVGIITDVVSSTQFAEERIRNVLHVLRDMPPLPADVLKLLKFCSDYYHHPFGETAMNALPKRLRQRQPLKTPAGRYQLTAAGRDLDLGTLPKRATVKIRLLTTLSSAVDGIAESAARAIAPTAGVVLKSLAANGLIELAATPAEASLRSTAPIQIASAPEATAEQNEAVKAILAKTEQGFQPWLLLGVTGSGKTEVYLRLIADNLKRGKQTLLLVPEINLTPQLETLVRARFPGTPLAALHSGLNESERLHGWLSANSGVAGIILGTRLAIFTPLPALGLVIVDEEQDASFKQTDGLRYSARDLALMRAKQLGITVVLGSATPALETFHNATTGNYGLLWLTQRINGMPPDIEFVDTRREALIDGISQPLLNAIHETTARGEQSLVFINRRGYAPVLICKSCRWTADCNRCSAKLVLHLGDRMLCCHHCGHREPIPSACPSCGDQDLLPLGQGTQRIESALQRIFPKARILRIDRDSTRRKQAWTDMREQIRKLEVDILVGTQILAKGHDFPQLNMVGVINADGSLYSTDFRASERLYTRLTQVAGRAGRGNTRGRVIIQTEFPNHPLYVALRRNDFPSYAQDLLAERKQAGFPPFVYQALLRAESTQLEDALAFLRKAAQIAAPIVAGIAAQSGNDVTVYDPVPANLTRLAGRERGQLTVQARSRNALHAFLSDWCGQLQQITGRKVRWSLDVDPLEI